MQLTTKQEKILSLAAKGLKDRLIADKLGISVRTVQNHLARIYTKIHTNNRVEAIMLYMHSDIKIVERQSAQDKKQKEKKD
jgi:DNA-binding NarL/FixJ family response regulator